MLKESFDIDSCHGPIIGIIADGWSRDLFFECLEDRLLPEIQYEVIDRGIMFSNVSSVFPSVSLASHATLLTGETPSKHGIPSHRWMTQEHIRNYIGTGIRHFNTDISQSVPTIFEKLPQKTGIAIQSILSRGAHKTIRMHRWDGKSILLRTAYEATRNPNSVIVSWLPKCDALAHRYGSRSTRIVQEMIDTSRGVGALIKDLESKLGINDFRILMASDHGLHDVCSRYDLSLFFRRFGLSSRVNPRTSSSFDVTICTSGESVAYLYFNKDVPTDQIDEVLTHLSFDDAVDLIFRRYDDYRHEIYSRVGNASVSQHGQDGVTYQVTNGDDPLGLFQGHESKYIDLSQPLILERGHSQEMSYHPDILHRYLYSYVAGRSANVLVTAAKNYHFGRVCRLGWRFGFYKGSHGGPASEEMNSWAIIRNSSNVSSNSNAVRSENLLDYLLQQ